MTTEVWIAFIATSSLILMIPGPINVGELYRKTLTITALNPKGIIFFSAFMPQFINAESNPEAQLIALATTFLSLAFLNALFYSLLARKVAIFFSTSLRKKWFDITGGTSLIGAGAITASAEY